MHFFRRNDIPVYLVVVACLAAMLLPGILFGPLLLIAGPILHGLENLIGQRQQASWLVPALNEARPLPLRLALLSGPRPPPFFPVYY